MVRYTMGGVLRRLGVALVFSAAAHYGLHLLEPLAKSYLHPAPSPRQRLPPPRQEAAKVAEKPLEDILAEAVYVPR